MVESRSQSVARGMRRRTLLAAAALSCLPQPARAAEGAARDREIDAIFASHALDGPGYVIGVVEAGDVIFSRSYGLADLARGRRLTPNTPMNLASCEVV